MFGTGRQYGLKISSYVDERQDPRLATDAACRYLSDLYDIFGDWDLALAAYNSGPGNVTKAIRRSGGYKNYWNIRMFLPRETAGYLPIFYATMYLFEYAGEHGLVPSDINRIQYYETDTIQIKRLISFEQIEKKTGINAELLRFLNPAYKLEIIPRPKDRMYSLVLPVEYVGIFVQNEEAIYAYAATEEAKREKPLPQYAEINQRLRYRVRRGDYLGKIARKFGVSVASIKRWNHLRSSRIREGQRLTIYPRKYNFTKTQKTTKPATVVKQKKPLPEGKVITHVVKQGDSLWTISRQYPGVSVKDLREWNGIWGDKLHPGTVIKLVLPGNANP
jgi:membrane-bound lytic murein transglycosylase D